jgi:hypothetical protein
MHKRDISLISQDGKDARSFPDRNSRSLASLSNSKLRSFNTSTKYKYGSEVPIKKNHDLLLDEKN